MFGGGATQYLATVQGMSNQVEKTFQKMISELVWDGKKGVVNKTHLNAPFKMGGIHLLDIQAHNEAIEIIIPRHIRKQTTMGQHSRCTDRKQHI